MSDLKPCPACGDEESLYRTQDPSLWFHVLCPECGISGPVREEASHAVNAWNDLPRRSDSEGLREENARLRDTVRDYWDDDLCRLFAMGYDREDAAQRGEPSPWMVDDAGDIGDADNWQAERIACVRAGLRAILGGDNH